MAGTEKGTLAGRAYIADPAPYARAFRAAVAHLHEPGDDDDLQLAYYIAAGASADLDAEIDAVFADLYWPAAK